MRVVTPLGWHRPWTEVPAAGRFPSARQRAQTGEEQGLGHADLLELAQVQRLVGTVRPRVGVLDPGDEDRGSGNCSAKAATNGIDPPTPMSTGSTPHASRNAARAWS